MKTRTRTIILPTYYGRTQSSGRASKRVEGGGGNNVIDCACTDSDPLPTHIVTSEVGQPTELLFLVEFHKTFTSCSRSDLQHNYNIHEIYLGEQPTMYHD